MSEQPNAGVAPAIMDDAARAQMYEEAYGGACEALSFLYALVCEVGNAVYTLDSEDAAERRHGTEQIACLRLNAFETGHSGADDFCILRSESLADTPPALASQARLQREMDARLQAHREREAKLGPRVVAPAAELPPAAR